MNGTSFLVSLFSRPSVIFAVSVALKNLSTKTMLALSSSWLDTQRARPTLSTNPRTVPYLDKAGNAETVSQRLAGLPAVQEVLKSIPLAGDKNLGHEVAAWLEAGLTLGKLETRRAELLHERDTAAGASRRGEIFRARNRWGRVTNAMLAALELDEQTSDAIERNFLRPLQEAEAKADRRAATEPQETPPPPPPPPPPPGAQTLTNPHPGAYPR